MTTIAIIVLAIIAISFCIVKTASATPISTVSVSSVLPTSNENSVSTPATVTPISVQTASSISEEKYEASKMAYNAINVPAYDYPDATLYASLDAETYALFAANGVAFLNAGLDAETYACIEAEIKTYHKRQRFSKKDLNKIVNKLSIEKVDWYGDNCYMHGFSHNYTSYNKNGQWFSVHCGWDDNRSLRSALCCSVEVYYFDNANAKREQVSLFEHSVNIISYRDLRLFIEYALRVKREYMKQTSIA